MNGSEAGEGRVRSVDGVEIAYSARGSGEVSLVFIHGGLADRTFWTPQLAALSADFRVVALDLAGHGDSGRDRRTWTILAFAEDVRAVADALDLRRIVLIGNSLGGPVALEAARLLRGRAAGVVGVDTLQDATARLDPEMFRARAAAFRKDFTGACRQMAAALFHPGSHPELQVWAEERMRAASPEAVAGFMEGLSGYDFAAAFAGAGVPIRAINGDLWPTRIDLNRSLAPDFDAVVMSGAGHYPMLERPEEFNQHLTAIARSLTTGWIRPGIAPAPESAAAAEPGREEGPTLNRLTGDMRAVIEAAHLCFAATVSPDGKPNLSPKGTVRVWDDTHIFFLDIASPGTRRNLEHRPWMELNVVEQLSRRGYRFSGRATLHVRDAVFERATAIVFAEGGVSYPVQSVVLLEVERATPLVSPGYRLVTDEAAMRAAWRERRAALDDAFEAHIRAQGPWREEP